MLQKRDTQKRLGVLLSSSTHIYTQEKEKMTFLTQTLMADNIDVKRIAKKVYKKIARGIVAYGTARAEAELARYKKFGPNWTGM